MRYLLMLLLALLVARPAHPCAQEVLSHDQMSQRRFPRSRSGTTLTPVDRTDYSTFYERAVHYVLIEKYRGRMHLFEKYITVAWSLKTHTFSIRTPVGDYELVAVADPSEEYPKNGLPHAILGADGRLRGRIAVYLEGWGERLHLIQWRLRSLLNADPYLSPHQLIPGTTMAEAIPSYLQQDSIDGALSLIGPKRAVTNAPGFGKTPLMGFIVQSLGFSQINLSSRFWKKPPKILDSVENSDLLRDSYRTISAITGRTDANLLFDRQNEGRLEVFDPNKSMTFITRTGHYNNRIAIVDAVRRDATRGQPWIVFIDEGQHRGRRNGQYSELIEDLRPYLGKNVLLFDMSGTYMHRELRRMVELVDGQIYGSTLDAEELKTLKEGRESEKLARTQFYRTTRQGYLSGLLGMHLVRQLGGQSAMDVIKNSVIFDKTRRSITGARAPKELIDDMAKRVRGMRLTHTPDRGIFFCGSIAQVDAYAAAFAKRIDGQVRVFYRESDIPADTLEWFNNKGKYDTPAERAIHKYIFVMRLLNEGNDVNANLAVVLKDYSDDPYGFGMFLQNVARCDRLAPFKTGWRLLDYSGKSRWFIDGLDFILVEDMGDEAASALQGGDRKKKVRNLYRPGIYIDDEWMTGATFRSRVHEIFGEEPTFKERFPFFTPKGFYDGAWASIRDHSAEMGIINIQDDFMVREYLSRLLERMPEGIDNRDLVEALLSDDWGWTAKDGSGMNKDAVAERLYNAIHEIARHLKTYGYLPDLDLTRIHEYAEFEKIYQFLCPDLRSMQTAEEIRMFLDPDTGTFAAIIAEAVRWGIRNATYPEGVQEFFVRLASRFPESPERDKFIAEVTDEDYWNWATGDGVLVYARADSLENLDDDFSRRRGMHRSSQRLYRAAHRVGWLFNRAFPEKAVDLTLVHTAAEFKKILEATTSTFVELDDPITAVNVRDYISRESGVFQAIDDRFSTFAEGNFSRDFGMKKLVVGMAGFLDEGPDREKLLADLENQDLWNFRENDGVKFCGAVAVRAELFHRASVVIAGVARKQTGITVTQEELKTFEGLTKLFDVLQHRHHFKFITQDEVQALNSRDYYCQALEAEGHRRGIFQLTRFYGIKRILLAMVADIKADSVREELVASLSNNQLWDWKATDFKMLCENKMPAILRKVDRAFQLIARRTGVSHGPQTHLFKNPQEVQAFSRAIAQ